MLDLLCQNDPERRVALCRELTGFDQAMAPAGERVTQRTGAMPVEHRNVTVRTTEMAQTSVVLAFPGLPALHPRREALALLAVALGGGMSSRLFQEVREKRALAYTIDCSESAWTRARSAAWCLNAS